MLSPPFFRLTAVPAAPARSIFLSRPLPLLLLPLALLWLSTAPVLVAPIASVATPVAVSAAVATMRPQLTHESG